MEQRCSEHVAAAAEVKHENEKPARETAERPPRVPIPGAPCLDQWNDVPKDSDTSQRSPASSKPLESQRGRCAAETAFGALNETL